MRRFSTYILPLVTVVLCSCGGKKEPCFEIEGAINGLPKNELIVLDELGLDNEQRIIDSTRSGANGHFELSGDKDTEIKLYRVRMGNRSIFVLNDACEIKIEGDWNKLEDEYSVSGSGGSLSLRKLMLGLGDYDRASVQLHMALDKMTMDPSVSDSTLAMAQDSLKKINMACLGFLKNYADTTNYLPVSILSILLTQNVDNGNTLNDKEHMDKLLASLDKRFGKQVLTDKFRALLDQNQSTAQSTKVKIGELAPAFTLKDVNGKSVSLSSFKGKYVLVDFWASWCAPCRRENPNVVAAYQEFKDKNFDILGVSLDTNEDTWKQAVKDDQLSWTQVSDLNGWKSTVVDLYGVQAIPSNYLVDPSGKIVAYNLSGEALEDKLQSIFGDN